MPDKEVLWSKGEPWKTNENSWEYLAPSSLLTWTFIHVIV